MDVGGEMVSVALPQEVFHSREAFFAALQEAARDQHPAILRYFGVKFTSGVPFVSLFTTGISRDEYLVRIYLRTPILRGMFSCNWPQKCMLCGDTRE